MNSDDWGKTAADWQPTKPKQTTFKQDLGGFFFHLAMVGLIGSTVVYSWHAFIPQPVLQIQLKDQ